MNTLKSVVLALIVGIIPIGLAQGADEPKSYVLLCKGGDNSFKMYSKMHTVRDNVRVTHTFMTVNFKRSTRAASAGLAAGSCAWADRGVSGDEPAELRLIFPQAWVVVNSMPSGGEHSVEYDVHGPRQVKEEVTGLLRILRKGGDFQVHAYNNQRGTLVVTKYGP